MQLSGVIEELKKSGIVSYAFLLLLTLVVYLPSIYFPFFFLDDFHHIAHNPRMPFSLENLLWYWKNSDIPVAFNVWQIIGVIGGIDNPSAFRFFNILIHFLNGVLLFKISSILLDKLGEYQKSIPLILSFVFLVHPVQVESVVWISSFRGTLATFFMFSAILTYCSRKGIIDDVFILILYVLGVFSKPIVGVLPVFLFSFDFFVEKKGLKKSFLSLYSLIPFVILFGFISKKLLPKLIIETDLTIVERFLVLIDSLYFYFLKSFFPLFLTSIYGRSLEQVTSSFSSNTYLLEILGFTLFLLFLCFRSLRNKRSLMSFGLIVFVIFYIPTSGLFNFHYQIISTVADRYMYIPLIGVTLIGIELWYFVQSKIRGMASEKILNSFVLVFFALVIFTSCRQVGLWSDDLAILAPGGKDNPNSYHVQLALGGEYLDRGNFLKAKYHLNNARQLEKNNTEPLLYLVDTLVRESKLEEAKQIFKLIPKESAEHIPFLYVLVDGLSGSGEYREAEELLEEAFQKFPYDDEIRVRKEKLEEGAVYRTIYSLDRILNRENLKIPSSVQKFLEGHKKKLEAIKFPD